MSSDFNMTESLDDCVLDNTAYPHLIDLILAAAAADPPTLLVLRSTSKTVREQVDRFMIHATVVPAGLNDEHAPSGDARRPALACAIRRRPLPYLPAGVKILDVMHGRVHAPYTKFLHEFTAVRIIRRAKRAWEVDCFHALPMIRTSVDFIDLTNDGTGRIDIRLSHLPSRNVIHFKYDVALFNQVETTIGTLLKFICSFLQDMINKWLWGRFSLTLVGMESVPECQRTTDVESVTDNASDWYHHADRNVMVEGIAMMKANFRCITLEEWWKELGDKKELLGVWPEGV
ncbi:hypothetical protein Q8F55_000057 [Vanrija albida]|uniref:F-box domain-containing protein n=1 Tax=Vanrija albida TaxID=181172 RepID=A0ABR3QC61_9TREE